MADLKWRLVLSVCVAIVLMSNSVMSSKELMTSMTKGFTNVVDTCRNELNVGDHIMQDMYNYWKEEYELLNRELGCMIKCMADKLDLMGDDQNMHHGKAHEFAKSHGANDDQAKQLVTIIHDCEKQNAAIEDVCSRVLEVAKCFRTKIHALQWAPSMEVVIEELVTSV